MRATLRLLPFPAAALAAVHAAPALAGPCSVELSLALPAEWHRAAGAIDDTGTDPAACERVSVRAVEHGAKVVLTTRDGRRAERAIEKPEELAPTVAALRVTVPEEEPVAAEPSPAPVAVPPKTVTRANPAADEPPSKTPPRAEAADDSATLIALSLGSRGGQSAYYSPLLTAAVSVLFSHWEVGGFGALEFQYVHVSEPELSPGGSAIAGGVFAGRRGPVGPFELFGGARLSLAALFANVDVSAPAGGPAPDPETGPENQAETRLGAYMGASVPRSSTLRLRADLAADRSVGRNTSVPVVPQWALGTTIGLELRL